jgi:hypothetical protein
VGLGRLTGKRVRVGGQMARRTHITVVDDIDGSPAAETIAFSYQGRDYEIDLSESNAARLRSMMRDYADHARSVGARRPASGFRSAASRRRAVAIREWARASGLQGVGSRGRIPQHVVEQYEAAHPE